MQFLTYTNNGNLLDRRLVEFALPRYQSRNWEKDTMGKKLNPEYRDKIAKRLQLPKCHHCHRRSANLVAYEGKLFHRVCIKRWEALLAATETKRVQELQIRRERHLVIKNWWLMSPQERITMRDVAESEGVTNGRT